MATVDEIAKEILGVDLDKDGPKLIDMALLKAALIAAKAESSLSNEPEKPKSKE